MKEDNFKGASIINGEFQEGNKNPYLDLFGSGESITFTSENGIIEYQVEWQCFSVSGFIPESEGTVRDALQKAYNALEALY